jgi:hypothetical protein
MTGNILATEVHRRLLNTASIRAQYIDGVEDGAHLAINYSAPDGWQVINIPGRQRYHDTDGYCCINCARVIQSVVDAALATAQTAIGINGINVQNMLAPPLQGVRVDERQAVIPHEYATTMENAPPNTITCDICGLLEKECRAKQESLIAKTKG